MYTLVDTVGIRLTDMSGNRMVKTCPIAEWHLVTGLAHKPFGYRTFGPITEL